MVVVGTARGTDVWLQKSLATWGIESLTDIQSRALASGAASGESLVVCAPTSSGKTLVAEIAAGVALRKGMRVLYLVSHRALADQKYLDLQKRFGETATEPLATVGLSTGDRSEGQIDAQLRVATYEKAIGLLLTGQIDPQNMLVVADELQILGDPGRGPEIETLCAIFRQRKVKQFIALTATVENPSDLAGWMNCVTVQSVKRSIPLHQEIWFGGRVYAVLFGQESGTETISAVSPDDLNAFVSNLITRQRGPVLVFTETRKEAARYAADFIRTQPRRTSGIALADQLELFSEPTEASDRLKNCAERCVAFHTADLSAQERQVLEAGFANSEFDVCFATSTLAAGVNFPFKTIVFPKLTYEYRGSDDPRISLSDYRNMSGRAGRLGLHDEGFVVLLPKNAVELAYAKRLVSPENDRLESVLIRLSLRKTLLSLVASRVATNRAAVLNFFENTLYWYQTLENNPKKLEQLKKLSEDALDWHLKSGFVLEDEGELRVTALGKATAISGLLPETALQFCKMLISSRSETQSSFDDYSDGLIYACCASQEFCAEHPSRFLPYVSSECIGAIDFWRSKKVPIKVDSAEVKVAQCARAIALYASGESERKIAHATGLSAGFLKRLALDVSWVLEGLHRISAIEDLMYTQSTSNRIAQLSRRVRWGVPPEALDMLRVAEREKVPGVGRQRAMELVRSGITSLQDILCAGQKKLLSVLKNSTRVAKLLEGVVATAGYHSPQWENAHLRVAESLGLKETVFDCYRQNGTEYERAILDLLKAARTISVKVIDNGIRQNVPDLLLKADGIEAVVECKTAAKTPALINKEDAWAVIQKSADFEAKVRRVTLGKPCFDESAKKKAAASKDITLVENELFIEAILRMIIGDVTEKQFMEWLTNPGVAEYERLPGEPTYSR